MIIRFCSHYRNGWIFEMIFSPFKEAVTAHTHSGMLVAADEEWRKIIRKDMPLEQWEHAT